MAEKITIQAPDGPVDVPCYGSEGGLAITPWSTTTIPSLRGAFVVTHLASRRCIHGQRLLLSEAQRWMRLLLDTGIDWTRSMESLRADPEVHRLRNEAWDALELDEEVTP